MDFTKFRNETAGCDKILHFDSAGSSLMPDPVYEAMLECLKVEKQFGGYELARRVVSDLQSFYSHFAKMLNASENEIAYVENATRAWDMIFYGLPLKEGDRVLTHGSEYASNYLAFLHLAKKKGIEIDLIPSDETGQIDVSAIPSLIRRTTKLIAITHIPTQGGLVNPAAEVGKLAKEYGIFYLLDACQSVGQLNINVKKIQCDVLTGTGRKYLRGPRGTGFLYISSEILEKVEPPFIDLHAASWASELTYELLPNARRFENYESYVAGRVGLAKAVKYANEIGLSDIETRITELGHRLRNNLSHVDKISTHDLGKNKCGIVTFTVEGEDPFVTAERLRQKNIYVSVSVLPYARLDLGARNLQSIVRASVHYFNTEDEINRFVHAVQAN